jgi:hypothetical protein
MRALMRGIHDLWCGFTNRCHVTIAPPIDDPDVQFLIRSAREANAAADDERRWREHYIEGDLMARLQQMEVRRGRRN